MIELEWTHDPSSNVADGAPDRLSLRCPNGWEWTSEPGEAARCGANHPAIYSERYGSCGGSPGHEHPHVWLRYGFRLVSISRRTRVEGLVA